MRPDVQAILACPLCRHQLVWRDASCVCSSCGTTYPIEQGVPNLLPPAAGRALREDAVGAENARLRQELEGHPWLKRLVEATQPPLPYDRHGRWIGQRAFDRSIPRRPGLQPLVLDLGSGGKGDAQILGLSEETMAHLIRTDMKAGVGIDFVADAHHIPMADGVLDGVVFQGVVEHVARPWLIAAEIVRVLRPGGVVFCEAPFIQWYHEDPKDYYRFTEDGLKALFDGCASVDSGVAIGPVGGVLGVSRELVPILFDHRYLYWPIKWVLAWLTYPAILLDRFYRRRPRSKTVALAVYLVARKT